MATLIRDKDGKVFSQSRNLRGMLEGARKYGGVVRLHLYMVKQDRPQSLKRPEGFVIAEYANGYKAETYFVSISHLHAWAQGKRDRKGTWFSGCAITCWGWHVAGSEHEVTA